MKKIFLLFFAFLLLLANISCRSEKVVYDKELSFVRTIFNFHVVAPGITRGSQPSEDGFRLLRDYCRVKTVLSFRNEKEHNEWEKRIVEKLGMKFINIPMSGTKEQNVETIEQCLSIIADKSNQPIFVHCYGGKDRTGLIFAAYRIKYDNWSLEDALMEMLVYGYDRISYSNLEKSLVKWHNRRKKFSKLKIP